MIKFSQTREFDKDFKKLLKKFRTLNEDFEVVKNTAIKLFHQNNIDTRSIFIIEGIGNSCKIKFYKIKKFACKSLKGRGSKSGIRIIYAYLIEKEELCFLEIYFKGEQENENRQRITDFMVKTKI